MLTHIQLLQFLARNWVLLSGLLLAAITTLSLTPLSALPEVSGSDKTHHLFAYASLMLPAALRRPKSLLFIALFFIAWSGLIEMLQPLVNRYGEWTDFLANAIGVAMGILLAKLVAFFINPSEYQ